MKDDVERIGTNQPWIGDTVEVLAGEHQGLRGNVRALGPGRRDGGGGIAILPLPIDRAALARDLVDVRHDEIRVVSTEAIDNAAALLTRAGWTLTPPTEETERD